jgi:hypothetical protein
VHQVGDQPGTVKDWTKLAQTVFSDGLLYKQADREDPSRPYKAKKNLTRLATDSVIRKTKLHFTDH